MKTIELNTGVSRFAFPRVVFAPADEGAGGSGAEDTNGGDAAGAGEGDAPAEEAEGADDGADGGKSDNPEGEEPSKDEPEEKDKPEEGKSEDEGEDKEDDKPEGAPDEYAAFDLPEGTQVDDELMSDFTEFAKGKNLSQEAAQEAIDLFAKAQEKAATLQQEKWDEIKEGWAEETRSNKALQDDDGKADAAIAEAVKAVEAIGGQPLKEAFDLTGAGNHPVVVEAFYKLSKLVGEDNDLVFGGGSEDKRTRAEKLYPSMKK